MYNSVSMPDGMVKVQLFGNDMMLFQTHFQIIFSLQFQEIVCHQFSHIHNGYTKLCVSVPSTRLDPTTGGLAYQVYTASGCKSSTSLRGEHGLMMIRRI